MILPQAVLQIFCWQGSTCLQCISWKSGIIQSNIRRILWNVNQVICIMYPNSIPDIMVLAQAVLQKFHWQDCFNLPRLLYFTKCQSQKREIIKPNIYRILPKLNQVIYTLDTICESNIMILAQANLQIFRFTMRKSGKGDNSAKYLQNFAKS